MRSFRHFILTAIALCALAPLASAQSIFTNPIAGTNPNTANPYTTGQTVVTNLTVSGIARGPGITGTNANDRYNANSWNTTDLDTMAYFTWTLTPGSGYAIDLASLLYTGQASGTGPTSFAFRSSADTFTANIGTPTAGGTTLTTTGTAFQNVQSAIEFRYHGWGASASTGTYSINDFTFNGLVSNRWSGAANGVITNPANYVSGNAPTDTNGIQFEGSANTAVTLNGVTPIAGVRFASNASAFNLDDSGGLTFTTAAGIANYSGNLQTIRSPLNFGGFKANINTGSAGLTISGPISATGTGSNGLQKTGTGTLTLTGDNTYTGNTTISAGTLLANNATGTATGTGNVTVASGAALAGTGMLDPAAGGGVTVNQGGAIRGGDPNGNAAARIGALTVHGNVTINSTASVNGIFRVEASRNTSTAQTGNVNADSSALSVTGGGTLSLIPSGNVLTIDIVNGTNSLQIGEAYTILLGGVDAPVNLQVNGSAPGSNATIPASNYVLTSSDFTFESVSLTTNSSGTALFLSFTTAPVPEPATVLGIAAGALALGRVARRRLRTHAVGPAPPPPAAPVLPVAAARPVRTMNGN